jgi:hypothetical protein
VICWQDLIVVIKKKKMFYHLLLMWRPCNFPYNMNMLVFNACSNQKPFNTQENHW